VTTESEEIKAMVLELGARLARTERKVQAVTTSHDDLREAVIATRIRAGLPVPDLAARMLARRVPGKLVDLVLGPGFQPLEPVAFVERLARGEGLLLVLSADAGRGKSTAAARGLALRPGLWVHAPDLARPPIEGTSSEGLDERMASASLLVVDDVGTEHSPSGYAASRLQDVIVRRGHDERPTVLTTNLSPADFRARYGDRVASRLNGDPLGWQTLTGADLRRKREDVRQRAADGGA